MSSDNPSTAREEPNFLTTASMRNSGMSGAARRAGARESACIAFFALSSVMMSARPALAWNLAADLFLLNCARVR
jgi:hypothetical protein